VGLPFKTREIARFPAPIKSFAAGADKRKDWLIGKSITL
jgi:hypothetical protein